MLCILLLLTQVTCDWVEISQNYYRPNTIRKTSIGIVSQKDMYANDSIPDVQWTKAVIDRVSNVDNIHKTPIVNGKSPTKIRPHTETNLSKSSKFDTKNENEKKYSFTTKTEEFEINNKRILNDWRQKLGDNKNTPMESEDTYKWVHVSTKAPKIEIVSSRDEEKLIPGQVPPDITQKGFQNNFESDDVTSKFISKEFINLHKNNSKVKLPQATTLFSETNNFNKSKIHNLDITSIGKITQSNVTKINEFDRNEIKGVKNSDNEKSTQELDEAYVSVEEYTEKDKKPLPNESDVLEANVELLSGSNSMDKMWKLIKVITDTIAKNTKRGLKSKVNYIENLKNMVLADIEERIDRAWPDDSPQPRVSRSAEDRGHVEFPSSEGALMSISFLTFAVFLIKLVLQVIHTYKNKAMMVAPAVVTAVGRAAFSMKAKD